MHREARKAEVIARYCKLIDRRDLDKWELAGWVFIAPYREVSDHIESIIVGWFEEGDLVLPKEV
jgi:hypothetical protein